MTVLVPGQWSLICVLINGSFIWWAFKLGTFSGWWTGYSYFKLFTFHEVEHKANWFSLGDTNIAQGILINCKRLGKEENFDGLKVLTLLVGILVKAALFPWWANTTAESCPWQRWRCHAGESIGKQLSHQAGAAGGQEYTLDTDALQTLARLRETETSSRTKQSLGQSHWAKW